MNKKKRDILMGVKTVTHLIEIFYLDLEAVM